MGNKKIKNKLKNQSTLISISYFLSNYVLYPEIVQIFIYTICISNKEIFNETIKSNQSYSSTLIDVTPYGYRSVHVALILLSRKFYLPQQ